MRVVQEVRVAARGVLIAALERQLPGFHGEMCAVAPTMSSGNSSRMPKTATTMPTVRNSLCQKGDIRSRTRALTTALSKESDTSRTTRIAVKSSALGPP